MTRTRATRGRRVSSACPQTLRRLRRRQSRRRPAVVVLVALAAVALLAPAGYAAFATPSAVATSTFSTGTVTPPTGLTAIRPCTSKPPAPAFRSLAVAETATSTVTVSKPTGAQQGDMLLAVLYSTDRYDDPLPPGGTADPDWVEVVSETDSGQRTRVFRKFATASEPASYRFIDFSASGQHAVVILLAYSGVKPPTGVFDGSATRTGSGETVTVPSITNATAPTLMFAVVAATEPSFSNTTGMTQRHIETAGDDDVVAVFDQPLSSAGATTARTVNIQTALLEANYWTTLVFAIKPAPLSPNVRLTWTPSTFPGTAGYDLVRTGGTGTTVPISGRTTSAYTDTTTTTTSSHTYTLTAKVGNWRSTSASVTVGPCV